MYPVTSDRNYNYVSVPWQCLHAHTTNCGAVYGVWPMRTTCVHIAHPHCLAEKVSLGFSQPFSFGSVVKTMVPGSSFFLSWLKCHLSQTDNIIYSYYFFARCLFNFFPVLAALPNPCDSETHDCDEDADCISTGRLNFTCVCNELYVGNGTFCRRTCKA